MGHRWWFKLALATASWLAGAGVQAAGTAGVASISPAGETGLVRQVQVRFDAAVVAAGDPRATPPYTLQCNGGTPRGESRWLDATRFVIDLAEPLPAGQRCVLSRNPRFTPLAGVALNAPQEHRFSTGAPVVLEAQPWSGQRIAEDQHFIVRTNGPVDTASLRRAVRCEVQGMAERIGVRVVEGALREALLKPRQRRGENPAHLQVLACERPLPPESRMRLVWGPGVAAPGQGGPVSREAQRFAWEVRPRFLAEFRCERENAASACLPLRPMSVRFNAPVPRELALAVRLVPERGPAITARADERAGDTLVDEVRFPAPLPESARFRIEMPAALRDDAGRSLANAGSFPLAVATGAMPPLARFAGAPFGIVESQVGRGELPMLPITVRQVQAEIAGARGAGQVRIKRLDPATPDAELLKWIGRLQDDNDRQFETRKASLLEGEEGLTRAELPQPVAPPAAAGSAPGAAPAASPTEVLGLPLPQRGYHVVEVASRVLGDSLLEKKGPMHVRTGVLVTNLAVHFKRGRSTSLVWVTRLDRGLGVAGARVVINDCRGQPLWSGSTGADGTVLVPRGFEPTWDQRCITRDGYFVTARSGEGAGTELGFVFSGWQRGIEPWRFGLATAQGTAPDLSVHTVFDRTLLRAGETVSMKHFVRERSARGLALPAAERLPAEVVLTHVGSGSEWKLPLAWPEGAGRGRSAESRWSIPPNARLGVYDVALVIGPQRQPSGSFRVEAFRVPLADARLSAPAGVQVAPREMAFGAQLNAMAGGPLPGTPLGLSALLRPVSVQFASHPDFGFEPPGSGRGTEWDEDAAPRDDGSRLVIDRLAAVTDAQGAARFAAAALPALERPSELVAELSFTDPAGEVQTVSQRVPLYPAGLLVGLRTPGWAAARDGRIDATALVLTHAGQPMAGRAVEVHGRASRTLSTRKRIVGGFYAYDNQTQTEDLGVLCKGSSDARGRLACTIELDAKQRERVLGGQLELIARARDDAGRSAEAAASVWLAGGDEWWFAQDNDDRIDVLPEQREIEPGGVARLQVRMPFRRATALVTLEREGVLESRVMTLTGREPVIELPVPRATADGGTAGWAPNVMVSVLVLRGRLREAPWWSLFTWGWREPGEWWRAFRYEGRDWRAPEARVDLAKPSFKLGVAELRVGLAEHRLAVQVQADKAVYAVREKARATVTVTHGGKPLAGARIAFAAVDEGLLALADNPSWKLLEAMFAPRPWGVETASAQGEVIGRRHYGRKALPPGGGGGRNPTRELFDTLLLWRGTVELDAQGRATIEVPLNDSLTSFRLVAVADAGADRFGTGSTTIRVSQDLQMLAGLAPLLREGDRFEGAFTLRNTTARPMALTASLRGVPEGAAGLAPIAPAPQTLQLAAGAAQELRWPLEVPAGARRIVWTAAVEERGVPQPARDRLQVTSRIEPAVPERVLQATLLALEAGVPQGLPLVRPAEARSGSVDIVLEPSLTAALPGLRRWFERYPYTCLEQRSSRAIGLRDEAAWRVLGDEITGYLDADGLAAYHPPAAGSAPQGSDRLTAYLLAAAHEAGWSWPQPAREAMLAGLVAFVEGRLERRAFPSPRADLEVRKLAALEALARHGRVLPRLLDSIAWQPAAWPTSAVLDAWSLYRRTSALPQREARLTQLQQLVRSRLVAGGTTLTFTTEAEDHWWWLMDGPDANALRLLLLALPEPAWQAELPVLARGIVARQKRGAWLTTTANLWGVLALEQFARRFESAPIGGRSSASLAGTTRTHPWPAAGAAPAAAASAPSAAALHATLTLPWPAAADAARSTLQLAHEGSGRPWVAVQARAALPLAAPLSAGYRLTRNVSVVQRRDPAAWSRGDVMRVRIEIEALADMAWVVVDDPVPSGAAVLGSGLGRDSVIQTRGEQREGSGWLAFEERAAGAFRAYYPWLPRGRHVVEYTLRLNTAGRFGLPPSRVEAMYAPESFGELPNALLEVRP